MAGDAYVTVSDVEVSDDEPEVGDEVYITPTISVSGAAENGVEIEKVYIRNGNEMYDEVRSLGTLGAGDAVEAPLMMKFDEPGTVTAQIRVVGNVGGGDGQGAFYVKRPVHIEVEEVEADTPPRLSIATSKPLESWDDEWYGKNVVQVEVSNGWDEEISDLRLTLEGPGVGTERRVYPAISAGEMEKFNFTLDENVESGELTATLRTEDFEVTTSETFDLPESGESSGDTQTSVEDTVDDSGVAETASVPEPSSESSDGSASIVGGGLLALASVAGLLWRRK